MSCDYVLNLQEFASSGFLEEITLEKQRETFFSAFSFSFLPHSSQIPASLFPSILSSA